MEFKKILKGGASKKSGQINMPLTTTPGTYHIPISTLDTYIAQDGTYQLKATLHNPCNLFKFF